MKVVLGHHRHSNPLLLLYTSRYCISEKVNDVDSDKVEISHCPKEIKLPVSLYGQLNIDTLDSFSVP